MKTASTAAPKWASKAGMAGSDYTTGAENTTKDQSQLAIAAKATWASQVAAAAQRDAYAKGLQKSGKTGWLNGIKQKGEQNYTTGVTTQDALQKYTTNSGAYDSARGAAATLPRGPKGSAGNLARVAAVANALHAAKVSK